MDFDVNGDTHTENFSPYQHKQARIIEFPKTYGSFATTFANSVPFSEARFLAQVNPEDESDIDVPFYVAAHEISHQWWGNQLLPADVLGAKMLTESMAEYSALKVLEKEYGKSQIRKFLKFLSVHEKTSTQIRRQISALVLSGRLPRRNRRKPYRIV